jgi:hypothetical protein
MSKREQKRARLKKRDKLSFRGTISESHLCVDCGVNTFPGTKNRAEVEQICRAQKCAPSLSAHDKNAPLATIEFGPSTEVYIVRDSVWKQAGMEPWGGCLCIGCIEKRIGRKLTPRDFPKHPFNDDELPGTVRLMSRRRGSGFIKHETGLFAVCGGEPTPVETHGGRRRDYRQMGNGPV